MNRRPRLKVLVPVAIAALLALFVAVGAVSTWRGDRAADSTSRDGAAMKAVAGAAQVTPELSTTDQGTAAADGGYTGLPEALPPASHYLVRNGSLSLVVGDGALMTTVQRITAMTQGMGGYVMSSVVGTRPTYPEPVEPLAYDDVKPATGGLESTGERSGDGYASLTLRVPESSFDDALRRFAGLGRVEDVSTSSEDVTGQFVDLQARLRHYRAVEQRLVRFLAETDTVKDMLMIQDRLDQVQLTIEQLTAELKSLRETTSYGTLTVSLHEAGATQVAAGPGNTFTGTFSHSLQLLWRGARLCALAVAAALPFLAVAAVVAGIVWYVRRTVRSRRGPTTPAQPA